VGLAPNRGREGPPQVRRDQQGRLVAGIHDEDEVAAAERLHGASGQATTTCHEEEVTRSGEKPCYQPTS
jgi:hypothetical protein